jgi:hypothetical protein
VALGQGVAADAARVDAPARILDEVGVHRFVREEERERLLPFPSHEFDRAGIQDIGHVALDLVLAAIFPEDRVDELALPLEAHPVVVPGPRARVVAHVPLADVRRLVAERLQRDVVVVQAMARDVAPDVVDDAVARGVLASQDRGAVRRAQRRRVEGILEHRALVSEAVDVGRFHVRMTRGAGFVEAQVVDQDHDQVGFLGHGRRDPARSPGAGQTRMGSGLTFPHCRGTSLRPTMSNVGM